MTRPRRVVFNPWDPQQHRVYAAEKAAKLPFEPIGSPRNVQREIDRVCTSETWQTINCGAQFEGMRIALRRSNSRNGIATQYDWRPPTIALPKEMRDRLTLLH